MQHVQHRLGVICDDSYRHFPALQMKYGKNPFLAVTKEESEKDVVLEGYMKQNSAAEMRTKITSGKYMAAKHLTSLFDLVQAGVFWDKIGKWRTVCAVQDGQLLDLLSKSYSFRGLWTLFIRRAFSWGRKGTSISTQKCI